MNKKDFYWNKLKNDIIITLNSSLPKDFKIFCILTFIEDYFSRGGDNNAFSHRI